MQNLLMPFKRSMMLCGYKNPQYKAYWGYPHYGIDVSTIQGGAGIDHNIYASGEGTVVAAGHDPKLGYAVAILYPEVYNHATGKAEDVIARYMHMQAIGVQEGQKVNVGDAIAVEGKEGTGDYHLHLEFDRDTKYPVYTPQVAYRLNGFWKKGTDTTINPSHILYQDDSHVVVPPTYNPAWLNAEDKAIPKLEKGLSLEEMYENCIKEKDMYRDKYLTLRQGVADLLKEFEKEE